MTEAKTVEPGRNQGSRALILESQSQLGAAIATCGMSRSV
jgi:hypothetical protein